jgi:tripartite-type tricarboxylate transporter receptor subunit TctC
MKLPRRKFLQLAAGAAALPALSRVAVALDYPTRPVHLVVAVPPGGAFDLIGRLIAQWLSGRLGQSFIVENRAGAATNVGTSYVAHSSPDGYTLLVCGSPSAINATLYPDLDFVFARDITPVAGIERGPVIMVVNPAFPAKTVPQFIDYAKVNSGKINMGTGGVGTIGDVAGALFSMMAGISLIRVPYRGEAPAVTDLIGGQLQVAFISALSVANFIKAGNLRALAVTGAARMDVLPDVPVIADFVPGYEASGWIGIGAPRGTSSEIIDKLNTEINSGLADAKIKMQLAGFGSVPMPGSPADFGKFIADETEKWAKVIKFAGIKPE